MDFERQRKALARSLEAQGLLRSESVKRAFLRVPRELFVWPGTEDDAYADIPLPLGDTGQTISAPHMVVIMLEEMRLSLGDTVLEVGAGSGYNAALMAEIVAGKDSQKRGRVVTVERLPELAAFARGNIARAGYSDVVEVVLGDGTLGYPPNAEDNYDHIMVTAAAPHIPVALKRQLRVGGTLLIPLGPPGYQDLIRLTKLSPQDYREENLGGCVFVPLVGEDGY
jgi:protein-L-isoaspartate(D-aspartate) O-methyltransferase